MKIAIVADTHFSSADQLLVANWRAAESWIAETIPALTIHLGDISADGVTSAAELEHARRLFAGCQSPLRFIPGNHDIGDHAAGPEETTDAPFSSVRLAEYRTLFGMDRWSTMQGRWKLIGLNAPVLATGLLEEAEQYRWLESELADHEGPLGIFIHKPLFRDTLAEGIVHTRYVPLSARVRLDALLRSRDLRFVCAGHTHQVRQNAVEGVEHVWAPSTAFTVPDFRQERIGEKLVGTLLLELEEDRHRFTHVIPAGMVAHDLMEFEHIYPALRHIRSRPRQ